MKPILKKCTYCRKVYLFHGEDDRPVCHSCEIIKQQITMKLIDWDKPIKSKISNKPCELVADSKLGNTKIVRLPDNTFIEVNPYGRKVFLGRIHPEPCIVNYTEPKKIPITFDKIKNGAFFRVIDRDTHKILIPSSISKEGICVHFGSIIGYDYLMNNGYEYRSFNGGPWHPCYTVAVQDEEAEDPITN